MNTCQYYNPTTYSSYESPGTYLIIKKRTPTNHITNHWVTFQLALTKVMAREMAMFFVLFWGGGGGGGSIKG